MAHDEGFGSMFKKKHSADKRSSGGGCCGFIRQKKQPKFKQTLVICRHSERADYVNPEWIKTEEGIAWPHDAPLTDRGHELARSVAEEIKLLHQEMHFTAIACSPYRRCLETAAAVAAALKLPVVVDQELGEVWDRDMPKEPRPYRSDIDLVGMVESLGMKHLNPILADGGMKLFGKPPQYPETLEKAKSRYIVRIETYINQSANTERNFVLVTHADAVAAALQMFQRGNADVQNLDFCARIIAKRNVSPTGEDTMVYADHWDVETSGVTEEVCKPDAKMEKYYEKQFLETVEEQEAVAVQRKAARTKTDALFSQSLRKFAEEEDEDEESEEDEKPPPKNAKNKV